MEPIRSLHEHIAELAQQQPDKAALLACDSSGEVTKNVSYGALVIEIEKAASYLVSLGVQKGDRIALSFKNSPELLILSWAAWASGIVTIPLDTKRDTGEQYQYKIELNGAKALIAQKGLLKDIDPKYLKGTQVIEFENFPDVSSDPTWMPSLDHQALVLFTSGTTSHPKGAMLSLRNLIVNADGIREWLRIDAGDTFLVNLPLHHINSTTFCLSTLLAGGTIAIPPAYSNSNFWAQVAKTGATITSIVQSILFDQVSREKEFETHKNEIKLSRIQIGSAPVVAHTAQQFLERFDIPLYQGYGQTETALRVTGVPTGLPKDIYEQMVEENSIGTAMPWADVRIADEQGNFLGEGEEGELVVKGDAIMEGYIGGEEAFRDGYFQTGDIGFYRTIAEEKFYFLKGRKREMIIKGGINISPVAVENYLKKISSDVDQVYVVGVEDDRYGEQIGAVICWKEGIDIEAAKRRLKWRLIAGTEHVSRYETPAYISTLSPEDLPLTSTGKVQRTVLKSRTPKEQFEPIEQVLSTASHRFVVLDPQSRYASASHELYNHCWQPLTVDAKEYKGNLEKQFVLAAIDESGKLAGQIAFIATELSEESLMRTYHAQLLNSYVSKRDGKNLVCVSICSADYQPKPVPQVSRIPSEQEVLEYLKAGNDPVMRFHERSKGGAAGAKLVGLIPDGRPDDESSLGYSMLLKYPPPQKNTHLTEAAPLSNQLIEAVLLIARDVGIQDVYAYSRPGGLASFISKKG